MASTIVVDKIQKTGGVAFTLPVADGNAGQSLQTDGSLALSWGDVDPIVAKGGDIASASPCVIPDGNLYYDVTGTTGFSAFTVTAGRHFILQFDAGIVMTHHATNLDLPGEAPITTVAGDVAEFVATGTNTAQCINYTRATGKAVVETTPHDATIGLQTIWVPAVAMYPTTTAGCDALAQVETGAGPPPTPELKTLDFPDGADSYAQFSIAMPKSWDESTITFQTYWSVAGTNTGTVGFTLSAVALSSTEVCTTAFGTAVANTPLAATGTISDLMVNVVSGNVTVGGTPAEGDQVFFQVLRDVSEDTQTSPARLHGIKIYFTTNAENDA
tara:strand:- start:156 stop:1142 length:987 start_codon:yes stop_codon:yes gene_type:complete